MSERIDQACENLRVKLNQVDERLDELKSKIKGDAESAQKELRIRAEKLERRIDENRNQLASAKAEAKGWLDERKSAAREKIADWKAKREIDKLENRAAEAESYAEAAVAIAAAALDDAEHATIEAIVARYDADAAGGEPARSR